jgi:NAD(P)-dependent dehydrogenase (short-subunit alcohol dehydrogenase family)
LLNASEPGGILAKLSDKTAIITGGSRGIGFAIAEKFIAEGARVMITGRDGASLDSAKARLGDSSSSMAGEVADPDHAAACIDRVMSLFGRIDILVNNAAIDLQSGPTVSMPTADFEATLRANLIAPLFWSQRVWEAHMKDRGGVILNMASLGGLGLHPDMGAYLTSKAGLIHLTRILAAEMAPQVRVNAMAPGLIKTEMSSSAWRENEERISRRLPLGRLGEVEDVAASALFLVGDDSAWITGETLIIDGGTMVQTGRRG